MWNVSSHQLEDIFMKEFKSIGFSFNIPIQKEELYQYMDSLIGYKKFDRDIANQLFEQMDPQQCGSCTIQQFVNVFLEAESILVQRLQETKIQLAEYKDQKCQAQKKHQQLISLNKDRQEGKMTMAYVKLKKVQKSQKMAKETQFNQPFMIVEFLNNQQQTEIIQNGQNLIDFNTNFTFPFEQNIEEENDQKMLLMKFYYYEQDQQSQKDVPIGYAEFDLNELKDQQWIDIELKMELTEEFQKNMGQSANTREDLKLNIQIQWIRSEAQHIEEMIEAWTQHIDQLNIDDIDYQHDLISLFEPFDHLKTVHQFFRDQETRQQTQRTQRDLQNKSSQQPTQRLYNIQPKISVIRQNKELRAKDEELNKFTKIIGKAQKLAYYFSMIAFLPVLFTCFYRSVFVDITIYFVFIYFYMENTINHENISTLSYLLYASIGQDTLWLLIYPQYYYYPQQNEIVLKGDLEIQRFVVLASYWNFIAKIVLSYFYYKLSKVLRDYEITIEKQTEPVLNEALKANQSIIAYCRFFN